MIIEIIVIILSFLITGYGIYRYGGNEREERQNVAPGNEGDLVHNLIINDEPRDYNNIDPNININNINNENTNNNINGFKKNVMQIIKNKEENNNIDWGDIETTTNAIFQKLIPYVQKMVQNPLAEIKEILNEEKLKKGEEVVKKWIDKNKGEEVVKKWIDTNSGFFMKKGFAEIARLIYNSEENTYMFKNIYTDEEEKKKLLNGSEIIVFLNKIKNEEEKKRFENLSDEEVVRKQKNESEEFEELKEEEEKKEKEEEGAKKSLEENRYDKKNFNISDIPINNNLKNENIIINKEKMSFKEQVNEQIEKNIKNINWEDLPGEAQKIHKKLTKDAKLEPNAFEKIEKILKEKKSRGGEEAVKNWLNEKDIKNKNIDLDTIITMFIDDKKANIYDISYKEIIVILDEKCLEDLSIGQYNQVQTKYMKLLEIEKKEEDEKEKELEEKKKKYDDEAEIAKLTLEEEPDDNNPDKCHIKFRLPDGEKILERKFLKTNKISVLYDYIKSIGREIFMEHDSTDFDILYVGFPPKNLENSKNNTLESEGLYPNSILQISEK